MNVSSIIRDILVTDGLASLVPSDQIVSAWVPANEQSYPVVTVIEIDGEVPKQYLSSPSSDRVTRFGVAVVARTANASSALKAIHDEVRRVLDGWTSTTHGSEFISEIRQEGPPILEPISTEDARDVVYYASVATYRAWHYEVIA